MLNVTYPLGATNDLVYCPDTIVVEIGRSLAEYMKTAPDIFVVRKSLCVVQLHDHGSVWVYSFIVLCFHNEELGLLDV